MNNNTSKQLKYVPRDKFESTIINLQDDLKSLESAHANNQDGMSINMEIEYSNIIEEIKSELYGIMG